MSPDPPGLVLHTAAFDAITDCRGLTTTEVARRSRVSQPHLSRLRNSTRGASEETAGRIASVLDVDVTALFPQLAGWHPPEVK